MSDSPAGTLWIVATPIGNLDDLSKRAIDVLGSVDVIAAEDTRHTRPLLQHYGISTAMVALHEHNERQVAERLIDRIRQGESMAIVSDAGTPLISDPGFRLVRYAHQAGVRVSPVPGACAAIAALSVAGQPSDRFIFEGFLPAKEKARRERLHALSIESRTLIFYESSHRIVACLADMVHIFGEKRMATLAREITKRFETICQLPLGELACKVAEDKNQQRGECVVLVAGNEQSLDSRLAEGKRVFMLLSKELPPARAAKLAAAITGAPRKALYQ